jgi:hypothetical protein
MNASAQRTQCDPLLLCSAQLWSQRSLALTSQLCRMPEQEADAPDRWGSKLPESGRLAGVRCGNPNHTGPEGHAERGARRTSHRNSRLLEQHARRTAGLHQWPAVRGARNREPLWQPGVHRCGAQCAQITADFGNMCGAPAAKAAALLVAGTSMSSILVPAKLAPWHA